MRKNQTKNDKLSWEIRTSSRSSKYLDFVSRIGCTSYLLIDNELGEREDIDRFAMPQGMFTPRISVIRCTDFSEFCIDRSIDISPQVTGFTRHGISRRNHLGFQKFQHVCMCKQTRCGLRNHDVKVGVTIWSNEWKMTIERKSVLWLDQLVRRSTAKRWLLCLCFSSSTKCYWAFTRWAAILWLLLNIHHDNRLMLPIS